MPARTAPSRSTSTLRRSSASAAAVPRRRSRLRRMRPASATILAAVLDDPGLSFAIAGGADAARFIIDPLTGTLAFAAAPDFEAPADADGNNVYDVVVSVCRRCRRDRPADLDGHRHQRGRSINHLQWRRTVGCGRGRRERDGGNYGHRVSILDIAALAFTIAGGADAARFLIDPATGKLVFLAAPDFEAPPTPTATMSTTSSSRSPTAPVGSTSRPWR